MINKKYSNLSFLSYLISGSTSDTKVACKVPNCKERTDLKEMRTHVGEHILRGHVAGPNVCGFCGLSTCENTLVQTSSKGVKKYFRLESSCAYSYSFGKNPEKLSRRIVCTNHVVKCVVPNCSASVWTYNFVCHYTEAHPEIAECDIPKIDDVERARMTSGKRKK